MDDNERRISDMYLAAALLSYGAKYLGLDRNDRSRQKFKFEGPIPTVVIADDDVNLHTFKNVTIEDFEVYYTAGRVWFPPSYPASVKQIKAAIHSG